MNPMDCFPHDRLTGVLKTDSDDCKAAAGDFGQIVSRMPIGVLVPADVQDISITLKFAAEAKIPVSIRGRGHSCYGQTQVDKGIVIDMHGMTQIHSIDDKSIVVDAGATWQSVIEHTVSSGLTPPILTDFLGLTVGGTLSVGGTGGRSHRFGMQGDQVLALEIVCGDGMLHHCTPDQNSELFYAALAGFGQCGIICRVTLKLIPAPQKVSVFRLAYPNAKTLLSAQTAFLDSQPFDHMEGWILPSPDGWLYMLEAAVFHDDVNAPTSQPPEHVRCIEQYELNYLEFLFRLGPVGLFPCIHQSPRHTHPWSVNFLPTATAAPFLQQQLDEEFSPATMGPMGIVQVYPLRRSSISAPLVRLPAADTAFMVAFFPCGINADHTQLEQTLQANYQRYVKARALGGTADALVGAIDFTKEDWIEHFGAEWKAFCGAKQTFDPNHLLVAPAIDMWSKTQSF